MRTAMDSAATKTAARELAINGGRKTISKFEGLGRSQVGIDEFISLADSWGLSRLAQQRIRKIMRDEEDRISPYLVRYYNPRPSKVAAFEAYAKQLFGVKCVLGVNSGTSALQAAYVACGLGPACEVIVPAYTFFATAASVVSVKAIPVIAEVDDSLTLDPADVERKITRHTKAIVPVHMVGNCSDMEPIMEIARKHNLYVIEDNAQSCGGSYKGKLLGTIGHMGCFSLSTYKITGAGEAGMVLTNDEWLHIRATSHHDTAACWRPDRYAKERRPGELFCGQNYRMSEMEGAINLIQLKKTRAQAKRFNTNMRRVAAALDSFPSTRLRRSNDPTGDVGYTLTLIAGDRKAATKIADALVAEGVPAGGRGTRAARDWHIYTYWEHILEKKSATDEGCPFTCPYYEGPLPEYSEDMCPRSVDLLDRAIFVHVNQWWTAQDCRNVAAAINKVCGVYG